MAGIATKICGITTDEALDAAAAGGAAWAGFVFFPPSPRDVAFERAAALIRRLPGRTVPVAVLVDPDDRTVAAAVAAGVRVLQLHGAEPPARVAGLRAAHGIEAWKAVAVRTSADLAAAARYRGAADRIVYDAKPSPGATVPGGAGLRFDWTLLSGFDHPLPWLLSGGLDAANLVEAVGVTRARAVDVSSGVETAPGVKSVDKIAAFLQAAARS